MSRVLISPEMKYFSRSGASSSAQRLALPRHQLEDQQRRDEAVVGVVEIAEVVVAGHLAAEDGVLFAHPALEEGVADPVHQRGAAVLRHHVLDRVAGAHVVEHLRAGILDQERFGQQRRHEVAGDELAGAVDEEHAVGVAVPRDADVGLLRNHPLDDVAAVLFDQRDWLRGWERCRRPPCTARWSGRAAARTAAARPSRRCRCRHRARR